MKRKISEDFEAYYLANCGKVSFSEMAKMFNVSKQTISAWGRKLNLLPTEEEQTQLKQKVDSNRKKEEIQRFLQLQEKYSYKQIAGIMGLTVPQVKYIAKKAKFRRDIETAQKFSAVNTVKAFKAEKRRELFGLEKKLKRKFAYNKELCRKRQKIRTQFRKLGCKVEVGSLEINVSSMSRRHRRMEEHAATLGFRLI